jgi:DNA-directed RNA polymerase specialized sigma24 family protein
MESPGSVTRLIDQLRSPDKTTRDEAARQIWLRYFPQLLERARRKLYQRVRRREDEDDVLQNMYLSFCARIRRGDFHRADFRLEDRTDLWRLLVRMTLRKAQKVAARHTRGVRDVRAEQAHAPAGGDDPLQPDWAFQVMEASDPTPAQAAIFAEEYVRRLRALPEPLRQVALWKLEGYTNQEIADKQRLNCTERTVERKLELIRKAWGQAENA